MAKILIDTEGLLVSLELRPEFLLAGTKTLERMISLADELNQYGTVGVVELTYRKGEGN